MLDDALHLKDYVKRWKEPGMNPKTQQRITYRRASFPEFYYDPKGSYLGIVDPASKTKIEAPWSAYLLALMKYGYDARLNNGRMSGAFNPPIQGPSGYPSATFLLEACAPRHKSAYSFPTLCVNRSNEYCAIDGNSYLPCYIAALQMGAHLCHWDNVVHDIYPDRSAARLKEAKENLVGFPAITRDTGWEFLKSASILSSRRYNRVVVFATPLTPEQERLFLKYLSEDDCPGYINGNVKHVEDMYIFIATAPSY